MAAAIREITLIVIVIPLVTIDVWYAAERSFLSASAFELILSFIEPIEASIDSA